MVKKQEEITTIRVSKDTANYVNDIRRMLELTLGHEMSVEEVVRNAAQIAYGEQLESLKAMIAQANNKE
jgi:hypothetical protein